MNKAFLFSLVRYYTTCIPFIIVIDIGIDHFHANAIQFEISIGSRDRFHNSVVKLCSLITSCMGLIINNLHPNNSSSFKYLRKIVYEFDKHFTICKVLELIHLELNKQYLVLLYCLNKIRLRSIRRIIQRKSDELISHGS